MGGGNIGHTVQNAQPGSKRTIPQVCLGKNCKGAVMVAYNVGFGGYFIDKYQE